MRNPNLLAITACCLLWAATGRAAEPENWTRFRGPDGSGHSTDTALPLKWDANSLVWKTPLKGRGQSSPVVWGDRIFLTTALEDGKQRLVFCVDANTGKVVWEQVAWTGDPEGS